MIATSTMIPRRTRSQITPGRLYGYAAVRQRCDEDHVLVAVGGRESNQPWSASTSKTRLVEQAEPLRRGQPVQAEARAVVAGAHGERERAGALVPDSALEDAGLALDPAVVRLLDVLAARSKDVEDEAPVRLEQLPRRAQGAQLLGLGLHVQKRAEGADRERDSLLDGGLAQVSEAQVEAAPRRRPTPRRARDGEHLRRRVDADHPDAGLRDRNRDPAGADCELDDGPAGGDREVDVEADVLGDRPAPGVIERAIVVRVISHS